jgi:Mn-dependent DtxR family transcriptional regulator
MTMYTKEQVDYLVATYKCSPDLATVQALAQELGVPQRSVIAKLSSLGVYQKKVYLTKRGETPVKKDQLIDQIATKLGVNPEVLDSLEKSNKVVLQLILSHL